MSTQQDIYDASFKNRPPMLNKDNYVPWSSRLLCYAKSKPNGKLIYNSILHGPYTDDELPDKEVKQIEADDQAIQTILLGLLEDIYAAVDSSKAFKLNYSTPTNNIKELHPTHVTGILHNQMAGNQNRYNAVQNVGNQVVQNVGNQNRLIVVLGIANQNANQNGNGNVVAARAEVNGNGNNRNQIRCYKCKGIGDFDEIKEVNANCILMANLQQASTSGTQTDKALVYDLDGSAKCGTYWGEGGKWGGTVEQHPATEKANRLKSDFKIREDGDFDKQNSTCDKKDLMED
ncbi:hypothetical protein Tco_0656342 [Tanacetum coccineum]|uniref:Uncharacterized protein n=1 Tax=Tanacetum coccineum TaxID=301880 RepID=A0ABQ4X8H5_9ASTR